MRSDGKPVLAQAPNDASAEKPCSAENRDSAFLHDRPSVMATPAFLEVPELAVAVSRPVLFAAIARGLHAKGFSGRCARRG